MKNSIRIFCDGCSLGNPGVGGIGIMIYNGDVEMPFSLPLKGVVTNNEAEYLVLLYVLKYVKDCHWEGEVIHIYMDSNLVVKQVNNEWECKEEKLKKLCYTAQENMVNITLDQLCSIKLSWIPREENKVADKLSKKGAGITEGVELEEILEGYGLC